MRKVIIVFCFVLPIYSSAQDELAYIRQSANNFMAQNPASIAGKDNLMTDAPYGYSIFLQGLIKLWNNTGDGDYFKYMQKEVDKVVSSAKSDSTGFIIGNELLLVYEVTAKKNYFDFLNKINEAPVKNMVSDLPFMVYNILPFKIRYASLFHKESDLHLFSREMLNAGHKIFYSRDRSRPLQLALLGVSLVDVLENFSDSDTYKNKFIDELKMVVSALTGKSDFNNNENSLSKRESFLVTSMKVYILAKGERLGFLPNKYIQTAEAAFKKAFNDFKNDQIKKERITIGALINASEEIRKNKLKVFGNNKIVLLDNYFNHETKKDITGSLISYHYIWDEKDNGGYSMFKNIFNNYGFKTATLTDAPTHQNLQGASVYIIVDPDTKKESEYPNYISLSDINSIYNWVNNGGTLLLFSNDSGNAEFDHFNQLASKFGIQFNYDSKNRVTGNNYEMGTINITENDPVFKPVRKVYIKEYSSIAVKPPATAVVCDGKTVVVASAKIGKGLVFAVGDPWFYNEYEDGRKIPKEFENYQAAEELVKWVSKN